MLDIPWLLDRMPAQCRSAILEQWVPPEGGLVTEAGASNTVKRTGPEGKALEEALASTIDKEHQWAQISIKNLKPLF